jgi:hypothetical protein
MIPVKMNSIDIWHHHPCQFEARKAITTLLPGGRQNEKQFPILARLAKIYLPIQATSAPAERVFSRASRIISNLRTGLTPAMAGRLLFVASNWDWYQEQVAIQQTIAEMTE